MSSAVVMLLTVALFQAIAVAGTSLYKETTAPTQETSMKYNEPGECIVAQNAESQNLWRNCIERAARVTLIENRDVLFPAHMCKPEKNLIGRFRCKVQNANVVNDSSEALTQHAGESRVLVSKTLVACDLREPLQCLLKLVAASDMETVELKSVPIPLQLELQGLHNIKYLRLSNMSENVRLLPYTGLATLPSLQQLDMSSSALQLEAGGEHWRPLQQLKILGLQNDELRAIPERAFFHLSQLQNLALFANQIDTIDENAFEGLSNLEYLSLDRNSLAALPPGMLRPTLKLRQLWLSKNLITELPQLGHLRDLEEILVNNKNKTTLSLFNDTFARLGALRKLKLESCRLALVPAGLLYDCVALVELSLRGNWLTELPGFFFYHQSSLRTLDLAHNRLRTLPGTLFFHMTALQRLDLSWNDFKHIQGGVFYGLTALENLDLSHNKLTQLDSHLFEGLSKLTNLSLSHNRLQRFLYDNAGVHMRWLKFVDFSYNFLPRLNDWDLLLLEADEIDVRHNNISRVERLLDVNDGTPRPRFLLGDNPFHCDCYMYHFLIAINSTIPAQFDLGGAQCSAPLSQNGMLLVDVQPDQLLRSLPAGECPANCTCELRCSTRTLELDCQNVPQTMPELSKYKAKDVRLRLHAPPADVGMLPASVRHVDLSGLQLGSPPAASDRKFNLTVDLSNNGLTGAPLALLEAKYKVLLADNPLACDCDHRESLIVLLQRWDRVVDGAAVRCKGGQWLSAVHINALCATRDSIAVVLSAAAITVLLLIVFRYRYEIRLLLGRFAPFDCLLPAMDAGMLQKKYDVFVSFSHHDEAFVQGVLVPALEGGRRPLRLCLHYRDWEVGDLIPEQIDRSVRESWRTLVVLSENFVKSVWGRHEFRAAHGVERVIVLVLGDGLRAMDADEELRAYKKTHTCIPASHPLVWDRIKDAVCRSKCSELVDPEKDEKKTKGGGLNVVIHNGQLINVAQ